MKPASISVLVTHRRTVPVTVVEVGPGREFKVRLGAADSKRLPTADDLQRREDRIEGER